MSSRETQRPRAERDSVAAYLARTLTPEQLRAVGLLSFNQWTFAMGAMVDTALAARELGSTVRIGFWATDTPLHDTGWTTSRRIARLLRTPLKEDRAIEGLRRLGFDDTAIVRPPLQPWRPVEPLPALPEPLERRRIRELRYRTGHLGRAILQVHPDFNTPVREDYVWPRRWVRESVRSYAWAYDQARELIRREGLTTVVVYNGRFTHDGAVVAAARAEGAAVLFYDTGGYDTDYDLTDRETHDWSHLQGRMRAMYEVWDPAERDEIGSAWFINRQTHADGFLKVFVEHQERGHLVDLPEAETLVVYFSSSGDEIAELEIDWSEYLDSQEAALHALADACRVRPGTRLVVRTHPHMGSKPADDLARWTQAVDEAAPDLHIGPRSPVDSYALMRRADIVFTYGSTSGVESGFIGRPTVVMGPSAYDEIGCALRIRRPEEIPGVLDHPPVPDPTAAIPFGLLMQRRGFSYEHVDVVPGQEPSVAGVPLDEASDLARKLSHVLRERRTRWLTAQ